MENQETASPTWWDLYKQRMEAEVCDVDLFRLGTPNKTMRSGSLSWVSTWAFYSGFKIGVIIQIFTPATQQGVIFEYDKQRFSENLASKLGATVSPLEYNGQLKLELAPKFLGEGVCRATQVFKEVEECAEYLRGVLKMVAPKELFL